MRRVLQLFGIMLVVWASILSTLTIVLLYLSGITFGSSWEAKLAVGAFKIVCALAVSLFWLWVWWKLTVLCYRRASASSTTTSAILEAGSSIPFSSLLAFSSCL